MINRWQRGKAVERVDETRWQSALVELPLLTRLNADELDRLNVLTAQFLRHKRFIGKDGLEADDARRTLIAAQACLPILNLDFSYYRDWQSLIIYPTGFNTSREVYDDDGVVHRVDQTLVGEAWEDGPLVLSWHDVLCRGDGFNVVIHECAHKLDMLNGAVNGFPPLHADMDPAWWTRAFGASFDDFRRRVDAGLEVPFDPYAADDPGEFFAVLSEAFFELPETLYAFYPPVYRQLAQFYRQDPARASVSSRTAPR